MMPELQTPPAEETERAPRVGEHALTVGDRIFYLAMFLILLYVLFSLDGSFSSFKVTRTFDVNSIPEVLR